MLESLMNNSVIWSLLALCTILAIPLAIYTLIVGKKRKEISYYRFVRTIVEGGNSVVPELELLYNNKKIKDLSITKFVIWNSGNEVINRSDIVDVKPLQILTSQLDTIILDARIVGQSDETNMFTIKKSDEIKVEFGFDYADSGDGIVVQILHTGESSTLTVDGKIKGGKEFKNINRSTKQKRWERRNRKFRYIAMLGTEFMVLLVYGILWFAVEWCGVSKDILEWPYLSRGFAGKLLTSVLFLISVFLMGFVFLEEVKKTYHINIPNKLRIKIENEFEENINTTLVDILTK